MLRATWLKIFALVLLYIMHVPGHAQSDDQRRAQEMANALQAATQSMQDMNAQLQAQRAADEAAAAERAAANQVILERDRKRTDEQMAAQRAAQQEQMDRISGNQKSVQSGKKCPVGTCESFGCYNGGSPCQCLAPPPGQTCAAN